MQVIKVIFKQAAASALRHGKNMDFSLVNPCSDPENLCHPQEICKVNQLQPTDFVRRIFVFTTHYFSNYAIVRYLLEYHREKSCHCPPNFTEGGEQYIGLAKISLEKN